MRERNTIYLTLGIDDIRMYMYDRFVPLKNQRYNDLINCYRYYHSNSLTV